MLYNGPIFGDPIEKFLDYCKIGQFFCTDDPKHIAVIIGNGSFKLVDESNSGVKVFKRIHDDRP
jgi:hypothetical protein